MAAIRAKLAEAKDKGGFKKDKTFRRKFDGFKVGGTGGHKVHRYASDEDKADAAKINAGLRKAAEPAPVAFLRSMTRSITRGAGSMGSMGSSSSGFMRSMSRMFTRKPSNKEATQLSDPNKTAEDYDREGNDAIDAKLAELNAKWNESMDDVKPEGDAPAPAPLPTRKSERKSKGVGFSVEPPSSAPAPPPGPMEV